MSVKVGDTVYLWAHAYLRVIGRVTAVLGTRRVSLDDASVILAEGNGYESLFTSGVTDSTTTQFVGVWKDISYLGAADFPFDLPKRRNKK
jgi:hypothetical protein